MTEDFERLEEVPRYGVLLGYLREIGSSPAVLDVGCAALRARMRDRDFSR